MHLIVKKAYNQYYCHVDFPKYNDFNIENLNSCTGVMDRLWG